MTRDYNLRAKATNAVLLPIEVEIYITLKFNDFMIPIETETENIIDFITSYSDEKINLVIDEVLKNTTIPEVSNARQCIEKCNSIYNADGLAPVECFRVIKMCLRIIEKYGRNQDVYGLLANSYQYLGQSELEVKYNKLKFETNPSYENKLSYAISLYYSVDCEQAIAFFNELMEAKPSDLIRVSLADLCFNKGHMMAAYDLYNKIKDEEYLSTKQDMMELIKKYLPNAPRVKRYRIDKHVISMSEDTCYLPIVLMSLPKEQVINGKTYYLDPIRRKPILKTPEEEIRQKTIQYLMNHLKTPKDNILIEESLNHLDKSLRDRIDILVFYLENGVRKNLLIVECKEPKVSVVGEPIEQVLRYNFYSPANYLMITNGNDSLIYCSTSIDNEFISCSKLPDFQGMHQNINKTTAATLPEQWERPERALLETPEYLENGLYNFTIGVDSAIETKVLALNIHYCLVDPAEKIPSQTSGLLCTIVIDHGLTYRTSGDPSGSRFDLNYRWLEVVDRNGNTHNVYLAVTAHLKTINDPKYGNLKGTSNIHTAVEHRGQAVHMLNLLLDRDVKKNNNIFTITHDGRRSRRTNQSTLDYVARYCPQLLVDGKVYLGTFDNRKGFSFIGAREQEFILRLIDYTLLRYELWVQDREKKIEKNQ